MKRESRTVVYDEELKIEAYRFEGIVQPFPKHFHEYYVIGFVEAGRRVLSCGNREYVIDEGSIVLFNPGDSHACVQEDHGTFDYRGFNISKEVMVELAEEVTGRRRLPVFSRNVICDGEAACYLRRLHEGVMNGTEDFGKEETLLFLLFMLIQNYGRPFEEGMPEGHTAAHTQEKEKHRIPEHREEIDRACEFMEQHYAEHICLEQICRHAALGKSTLLRAFTKSKGITPYRYLENIRISEAKKLLGRGVQPVDAAIRTGFSDQSHFTNYFSSFIGLSPGAYREIFFDKEEEGGRHEE